MALEREPGMPSSGSTVPPHDSTLHDPAMMNTTGTNTVYDRDTTVYDRGRGGGSNFLAFLIGGLVIAMGLLAFLFYDGGSTGRDVSTTSSTTPRIEAPASPTAPATPTSPSRPTPAQ